MLPCVSRAGMVSGRVISCPFERQLSFCVGPSFVLSVLLASLILSLVWAPPRLLSVSRIGFPQ